MKILKILKQILGWFLFAEACSWILNYVGIHVIARCFHNHPWGWNEIIGGHIVVAMAAACFYLWHRWSLK